MFYKTKHLLKTLRYHLRRAQAARRWGAANLRAMPAVLGNAMPKSGSHLLIQILEGLTELGPFVNPGFPPVNRAEDNTKLPDDKVLAEIRTMRPGDIRYGYLHAEEPWLSAVTGSGRARKLAILFVSRDPRDWVISQIFYAKDMHEGHMLHAYYQSLPDIETRINAAIEGVQTPEVSAPSVVERYSHYLGWLDQPGVLCLRFEDLIQNREMAIGQILDYLTHHASGFTPPREQAIAALTAHIAPRKSGTFRKGQPGNWREHFTAGNVGRFKEVAGELLFSLGYEETEQWN
ncbi:MAG: sulfotransferase domain-containing protein [Anaerolineales bacterium]|nr:sulfotransferase domain-containing protein [Anaerolineales bacterium]